MSAPRRDAGSYTYDPVSHRYRAPNGRYVSSTTVHSYVVDYSASVGKALRDLTQQLREGTVSLAEWQTQMSQSVKSAHLSSAIAAKGGRDQMTQSDYGRVGQILRTEYGYLGRFADGIADGSIPLDGRALARAEQYGKAARETYANVERREMARLGMTEERNERGKTDSCDGCLSETARGWVRIGALSLPGTRTCLSNCGCLIAYRDDAGREFGARADLTEEDIEQLRTERRRRDLLEELAEQEAQTRRVAEAVADETEQALSRIDADVRAAIEDQRRRLERQYPVLQGRIQTISDDFRDAFGNLLPDDMMMAASQDGRTILINPNFFGSNFNTQAFRSQLKEMVDGGWLSKGSGSVEGLLTHEVGHILQSTLAQRGINVNAWVFQNQDVLIKASNYAATSPREAFAETFADLVAGRKTAGTRALQLFLRESL